MWHTWKGRIKTWREEKAFEKIKYKSETVIIYKTSIIGGKLNEESILRIPVACLRSLKFIFSEIQ